MAFVEFTTSDAVNKALELDGSTHMDRYIKVKVSNPRPAKGGGGGGATRGLSEKPEGCTTVFVGNLSWNADDNSLQEAFSECGEISSVRIAYDKESGKSRGFGHVEFTSEEGVAKAIALTGTEIAGRAIRVDYAGGRSGGGGGGGGGDRGGRGRGRGRGGDRGRGRGRGGDRGRGRGRGRGGDRGRGRGRGGGTPRAEGSGKKVKLE